MVDLLKAQAGAWFVGFVISVLAIFSSKITEYIKFALNSADLRSKYYEELAVNLSDYNFEAELTVEFLDKGWTTAATMSPLMNQYNDSITELRKKEYVYLSWMNRYWGKAKVSELEGAYAAAKTFDTAIHSLNDEFEAVNITKSKQKVDPEKAKQAMTQLRPALANLQERSKKLLMDLQ